MLCQIHSRHEPNHERYSYVSQRTEEERSERVMCHVRFAGSVASKCDGIRQLMRDVSVLTQYSTRTTHETRHCSSTSDDTVSIYGRGMHCTAGHNLAPWLKAPNLSLLDARVSTEASFRTERTSPHGPGCSSFHSRDRT